MKGLQKNSSQKEIDLKVRTCEAKEHSLLYSAKRRSAPSFTHPPNRLSERPAYWAPPEGCDMPAFRGPQVGALRCSSHLFSRGQSRKKKRPHCLSWKESVGICISGGGSHWSQATKAKQKLLKQSRPWRSGVPPYGWAGLKQRWWWAGESWDRDQEETRSGAQLWETLEFGFSNLLSRCYDTELLITR